MAGLGFGEFIAIIIIAIVIYGKDLPQIARKLAFWYGKVRRQLTDIKDEFHRQVPLDDLNLSRHMDEGAYSGDRPPAPDGLTATPGDGLIRLTWDPADDAEGYVVKRTTDPAGVGTPLAWNLTTPSFEDFEVQPGVEYTYRILATNKGGEGDESSEVSARLPADRPLATAPSA